MTTRDFRKKLFVTLEELSSEVGIDVSTLSKIENGNGRKANREQKERIRQAIRTVSSRKIAAAQELLEKTT